MPEIRNFGRLRKGLEKKVEGSSSGFGLIYRIWIDNYKCDTMSS